jgi:uncharacterized paraquat-inducible protein A
MKMNWLKNFMSGRHGSDQLSMALLIFSVILTFVAKLVNLPLLALLSYIPLGICLFRMLSKNNSKRSMENYKFAILISPIYSWLKKTQKHAMDSKTHRFFKCPSCNAKLRLPKGKGKIIITCPKCKTEFAKRT